MAVSVCKECRAVVSWPVGAPLNSKIPSGVRLCNYRCGCGGQLRGYRPNTIDPTTIANPLKDDGNAGINFGKCVPCVAKQLSFAFEARVAIGSFHL